MAYVYLAIVVTKVIRVYWCDSTPPIAARGHVPQFGLRRTPIISLDPSPPTLNACASLSYRWTRLPSYFGRRLILIISLDPSPPVWTPALLYHIAGPVSMRFLTFECRLIPVESVIPPLTRSLRPLNGVHARTKSQIFCNI
ncbi:hypothetical protein Y032_0160g3344 [Ancylostoma ceylanicum]|uniref:Uncharacterized protein n=1 Tax=Ancylostoma ceylanicum TaxID=53326 RepID=A0A016SY91_9BILA|nr:hypothetical protein Y032_0160g3344 [Ancylostoma ceylanicum]